jgi:hypothetical protein
MLNRVNSLVDSDLFNPTWISLFTGSTSTSLTFSGEYQAHIVIVTPKAPGSILAILP